MLGTKKIKAKHKSNINKNSLPIVQKKSNKESVTDVKSFYTKCCAMTLKMHQGHFFQS